ncbi:MAG TPA: hypothetical protein VK720_01450 [Terracidiphilus sp.]|jgi:hypothetical protein|nr:hypothetical protein [Terracidiphilus sp.]
MKARVVVSLAASAVFFASALVVSAQGPGMTEPPKVLVVDREYLKPGKSGSLHEKTEAAFVKALNDAKSPTHYLALDSLSGPSRSLFFLGYGSFEEWGKSQEAEHANATLSAALDQAYIDDGELLSESGTHVFLYHPEMSLHAGVAIEHMRYFEISQFHIKPGHRHEWEELAKLYKSGFEKTPEVHWAAYESIYGENNGGLWAVINPMRSLDEVDKGMAQDKQLEAALGEAGMKRLVELSSACIESSQTNVFVVNTKNSYSSEEWVKAAPEVWGQH